MATPRYKCDICGKQHYQDDKPVCTTIARVLDEVAAERVRQHAKWGEQNHPDGTGLDPHRQVEAEMAKELCDDAAKDGSITYRHILQEEMSEAFAEADPAELRAELIQVAAVAVAWVEAIDRR